MTPRRWLSIFATVCLSTALLLVAGLFHATEVVRRSNYPRSTGDPAVQLQESAFTLRNTRCDVLIYGDSTANVGIDPRLITARTGLSACNIAVSRPVIDDLDTLPLDSFLQHNPAPKLIVFQFGPEVFFRKKSPWPNTGPYPALVMLSRDVPAATAFRTMLLHPAESVQFVLYVLQKQLIPGKADLPRIERNYDRVLQHAAESNGQLDLGLPPLNVCPQAPLPLYGPVDTAWIDDLHRKYEARGIAVLVRAAPIPACDPQLALFRHDLASRVDGDVEALPIQSFVAGGRHTTQQGSQAASLGLVNLIQAHQPNLIAPSSSPSRQGTPAQAASASQPGELRSHPDASQTTYTR